MEPIKPLKPIVPPPALRVARALLKLSQEHVCRAAEVTDRSLRQAESKDGSGEAVSHRLRRFYESSGIVFLGTVEIASGVISGCGARWWDPSTDGIENLDAAKVQTAKACLSFRAARAFLGISMRQVAGESGLNKATLIALEGGAENTMPESQQRLTRYYEKNGIHFLGRRDLSNGLFLGVGVELRERRPSEHPSADTPRTGE